MFELLSKGKHDLPAGLLTEDEAREIVETEIARRGWKKLPNERYRIERHRGRYLWSYHATRASIPNLQIMGIAIDAATGAVVSGGLYPEKPWGPR